MLKKLIVFVILFHMAALNKDIEAKRQNPPWYLGSYNSSNNRREKCSRRKSNTVCPDPDITFQLYTNQNPFAKIEVDASNDGLLLNSGWKVNMETVILIHGYNGNPDKVPIALLRDAYIRSNKYNVIMVNWGPLAYAPCYSYAVRNMGIVGRCTSLIVQQLQRISNGNHLITCTGHSLGAHICGFIANHLTTPMYRIIGLDPAKPSISSSPTQRLDYSDATSVQIILTNAGRYGTYGGHGSFDICINGGRIQPYCRGESNEALCSHVWSVCYLAESLFKPKVATPCVTRCPYNNDFQSTFGESILIGDAAPITATGMFCVQDDSIPYCPLLGSNIGDIRCCIGQNLKAQNRLLNNETYIF